MRLPLSAVLACLCTAALTAAPVPPVPTVRLRPQGPRVSALLERALALSPTVQRIVDRLEAGDVIVYVELNDRLDPQVSACLTWMAATASRRIVRASIKPRLREREAIALLAHELQHALEVLEHPEVRSSDGSPISTRASGIARRRAAGTSTRRKRSPPASSPPTN
jgi:hypothetical protein